jgi:hypothetical protein
MDLSKLGPFVGISYKGRQILDHDIKTEADRATNRIRNLVTSAEESFDPNRIVRPGSTAFDAAWKEARIGRSDVSDMVFFAIFTLGMLWITGHIGIGLVVNFFSASFPNYADLLVAVPCGIIAAAMLAWFVCGAFEISRIIPRGFRDTWKFRGLAAQAWYVGERALHAANGYWGYGRSSQTISYEKIGAVVVEGDWLKVRGQDGTILAGIVSPSGDGMTAGEIAAKLIGLVKDQAGHGS